MPKMITLGSELIRINPAKTQLSIQQMVDVSGCLVAQVLRMEHLLTYCHLGMSLLQLQAKESMLPQTRAVFGYQDVQVLPMENFFH